MAVKLAAYYRSLQGEGFTREEALKVVLDYQATLIRSVFRDSE